MCAQQREGQEDKARSASAREEGQGWGQVGVCGRFDGAINTSQQEQR